MSEGRSPSSPSAKAGSKIADACAAPVDERTRFIAELFERHRRALLKYLTDLLRGRDEAEDALQETYVRLLGTANLDRSPSRARAYLFKIATHLAYDRFRSRQLHGGSPSNDSSELASREPSPERIVAFEQGLAVIKKTLLELKPRCRRVFLLRATEELSFDEIAERLGISKRTVEREMRHALEVCQKRLRVER